MGALSEEGLEGNNKDIRNYLERFCRKTSIINQITDVMNRFLERSDPRISKKLSNNGHQKDAFNEIILQNMKNLHKKDVLNFGN